MAGHSVPSAGTVSINFSENPDSNALNPTSIEDVLDYSTGVSLNLGAYVSFSYNFKVISLTVQPDIGGTYGTASASLTMRDMDGDGTPEHVLAFPGDDGVRVKKNILGKTGLLKAITLPPGGRYELDYERSSHSIECPQSRWVMSSFIRNDASKRTEGGIHQYQSAITYEGACYDREDRQFLGFSKVTTRILDEDENSGTLRILNRIVKRYENNSYERRGLLLETLFFIGESDLVNREITTYPGTVARCESGTYFSYPAPVVQTSIRKEIADNRESVMMTDFTYDGLYGNVTRVAERIEGDPDAGVILEIRYDRHLSGHDSYRPNLPDRYLVSLPTSMEVRDADGALIRRRKGAYDNRGNPKSILHFSEQNVSHEYEMDWDDWGNLISLSDPRGYRLQFEYDRSGWKKYLEVIRTDNAESGRAGYDSRQSWNYSRGLLKSRIDRNEGVERREYDEFGRLTALYTPYDEDIPALAYEYRLRDQEENSENFDSSPISLAISRNKVSFESDDTQVIETVTYIDGLGRTLQTAKTGMVYLDGEKELGWNVSGALEFDAKARVIAEGQSIFISGIALPELVELKNPTRTEYDGLDRPVTITFPGNPQRIVTFEYGIDDEGRLIATKIDPEGNRSVSENDRFGRIRRISRQDGSETILMEAFYDYRPTGELVQVAQEGPKGEIVTVFTYDLRGACLTRKSPERGLIEFEYDEVGNITRKVDANLRRVGTEITYEYDDLNRLITVRYPDTGNTQNIEYSYGESGSDYNRAGRLVSRKDGSGEIEYRYGELGEVIWENRTLKRQSPQENERSTLMQYQSDYLGRMRHIVYPDEERIDYEYDEGGQINRIVSTRLDIPGYENILVESIGYDEFGQRLHILFGNGTETTYEYDPYTRWLSSLTTQNEYNQTWQDITYSFDSVGNVRKRTNTTDAGTTNQTYEYDDLYQIVSSRGTYEHRPYGIPSWRSTYSQQYTYDNLGNMLSKVSSEDRSPPDSSSLNLLNYSLEYTYGDFKPHQATQVGSLYYSYDENGNIIEESVTDPETISSNDRPNLTRDGEVRIADRGFGLVSNPEKEEGEPYKREFVWDEENHLIKVLQPQETISFLYDGEGERTSKYTGSGESLYYNSYWSEVTDSGDIRQSKHIFLGSQRLITRIGYNSIQESTGYEDSHTYTYHPDHLGSASLITDHEGEVYERIEYTPWGELWVEIQNADSSYRDLIPFRFTGKEWDEETGLYYYGARYYEPQLARWMSADPAGFELINPMGSDGKPRSGYSIIEATNWYSYVSNNPVRYIDPTGMKILDITSGQYMNSSTNRSALMGSRRTGDFGGRNGAFRENNLGNFGCLFIAAVNIGNSEAREINMKKGVPRNIIPYLDQSAASLAGKDKYFRFDFPTVGGVGADANMNESTISALVGDMTGILYSVLRNRDAAQSQVIIKEFAGSDSKNGYIIADVGGHFVNVTGVDEKGNLSFHDTSDRNTPKNYTLEDVRGVYVIQRQE